MIGMAGKTGDFSGGADFAAQLGVSRYISTGNVLVDTLLVMLLPMVFREAFELMKRVDTASFTKFLAMYFGKLFRSEYYERRIALKSLGGTGYIRCGSGDAMSKNDTLIAAIDAYVAHTQGDMSGSALQLADTELLSVKSAVLDRRVYDTSDTESDSDDEDNCSHRNNTVKRLKSYRVVTKARMNTWEEVGGGVQLMRSEERNNLSGENAKDTTFEDVKSYTVRAHGRDAAARCDSFVRDAYTFYISELDKKRDVTRYMYIPIPEKGVWSTKNAAGNDCGGGHRGGDSGEGEQSAPRYRRYQLSGEKTFDSFFHPEKENLERLLDNFLRKEGKFGVKGYPHKLGLLLHGPPGTGKTSFIKALAERTGRNIVSVPLSRIQTNQELMDIVISQRFSVNDEEFTVRLPYNRTIFIFEDIDAASGVVLARNSKKDAAGGDWASSRTAEVAAAATAVTRGGGVGNLGIGSALQRWLKEDDDDKLDLAGLLNVLDGVIDTPGRLLVMTTNHPESLDPALIRPGRIDHRVYMGYMRAREAEQMVAHYFGALSPEDTALFREAFAATSAAAAAAGGGVTPAELEAECGSWDDVRGLAGALHAAARATSTGQDDEWAPSAHAAVETEADVEAVEENNPGAANHAGGNNADPVPCASTTSSGVKAECISVTGCEDDGTCGVEAEAGGGGGDEARTEAAKVAAALLAGSLQQAAAASAAHSRTFLLENSPLVLSRVSSESLA